MLAGIMSKRSFEQIEEQRQKLRHQSNTLQDKYRRTRILQNGDTAYYFIQMSLIDKIKLWKTRSDLCSLEIEAIQKILLVYQVNEYCYAEVYQEFFDLLQSYEKDREYFEKLYKMSIC